MQSRIHHNKNCSRVTLHDISGSQPLQIFSLSNPIQSIDYDIAGTENQLLLAHKF
jgi:hypothetical protein